MTNEDIRKPQDLKDVTAGQVPHPVHSTTPSSGSQDPEPELKDVVAGNVAHPVHSTTPSLGGQTPDPSPDPSGGRGSPDDLADVTGGNIAHPVSHVTPGSQPADPSPNPGPGLGIEALDQTTAGASAVDAGAGGRPPNADPDPAYDPPPGNIGGGADITQGNNAGQTG